MLLVTVQPVKAVIAQIKDQAYVCTTDYISIAKGKRVGYGHIWNESHHKEARRGTRSKICGIDTAKQDEELDLGTAFGLGIGTDPLVPGDMCNSVLALEVGTVFTLWEIALSASPARAVGFVKVKFAVTVALPVSRADPIAIACSGTRRCLKRGQRDTPCCYPALTVQLDWLDFQRHEEKFLAPAVHTDTNGTRTCFPQFAMSRSSGIYRRVCTTSPAETGHGTRVLPCVRLYHSGNCIRSDKTSLGRVPGGPAQQMLAH